METNRERIAYHNQLIDQAQAKVDALPDAGTGAETVVQPLTVTENGTYEAPDGVDGYSPVTVDVPGIELPELDTPGTASDLRAGKELIGSDGSVVEGTMEDVEVPAPAIAVSADGRITANAEQSAGYTPGGTKSAEKQLDTKAGTTITPTKAEQVAVEAGVYTTGDIKVAAIPAQYPDVSGDTVTADVLFDGYTAHDAEGNPVAGAFTVEEEVTQLEATLDALNTVLAEKAAGSGGSSDVEISLLTRSITEYSNPALASLGAYAFAGAKLTSLHLPALKTIAGYVFTECSTLEDVYFPLLEEIPYNGFRQFTGVVRADLPSLKRILSNGCYNCTSLDTLILRSTTLCTLAAGTVLTGTKIASGNGYIYVPAALVDSYKAAANWTAFAARFRALEDYTVDGTITGAIDESKI